MAEQKVKVEGLTKEKLRIFARVDTVEAQPTELYDSLGIEESERATWHIKPANPVVMDKLREVQAGIEDGYAIIESEHAIDSSALLGIADKLKAVSELGEGATEESVKAIGITDEELALMESAGRADKVIKARKKSFLKCAIADSETRGALAECVERVDNYMEIEKGELVLSKKSAKEIVMSMPDILAEWLYYEIEHRSTLTNSEYLGV